MPPDREIARAVRRYQLAHPDLSSRRPHGELLGRGFGSSREFQDYRQYTPGDDLRHLDWAAYARSDVPMIRRFREEISPKVNILLDASASMTAGSPAKASLAQQIAVSLALLAAELGDVPKIVVLDDQRPLRTLTPPEFDHLSRLPWDGGSPLPELLANVSLPSARGATRIVISDFLFPHDPRALLGRLAADAAALVGIQVLSRFEAHPATLGGRRLIDCETSEADDILIDEDSVADYERRLGALQRGLSDQARRQHARFVTVIAENGLEAVCRDDLCPARILQPA